MKYTVLPGDSISKIARDVLGDINLWPEIARLNNLANAALIYPGQVLTLPVGNKASKNIWIGISLAAAALLALFAATRKKEKEPKK
jgi:LysM repeat protein